MMDCGGCNHCYYGDTGLRDAVGNCLDDCDDGDDLVEATVVTKSGMIADLHWTCNMGQNGRHCRLVGSYYRMLKTSGDLSHHIVACSCPDEHYCCSLRWTTSPPAVK
jgi:hypothetical protein